MRAATPISITPINSSAAVAGRCTCNGDVANSLCRILGVVFALGFIRDYSALIHRSLQASVLQASVGDRRG